MVRTLVALGGNALTRPGGTGSWEEATVQMRAAAPALVQVVVDGGELLLTHGNGPQVGRLLRQDEISEREVPYLPVDVLGAESQAQIGYLIQQELGAELERAHVGRPILPIVSRVEVSRKDPAFAHPSKPVGGFYSADEARLLGKRTGWTMAYDGARGGWRRLLPSPKPIRWLEAEAVQEALRAGLGRRCVLVVAGGGGVPVVRKGPGTYEGVEAVIDKDLTAALVARDLGAERLAIVTDVPAVALGFHKPWERWLGEARMEELERGLAMGEFADGSMGPKIGAVLSFLKGGGKTAVITDIPSLARALHGEAGTRITRD
jgi:carbamate kinase